MNVTEPSGTALGGLVFLPACVEADTPLLVYLHGAGERGTRTDHMCRHGIPRLIVREGWEIPAIVLCPQCPAEFVWDNVVREVKSVIDDTVSRFAMRTDRISLTGCSMGGFGAWEMGMTYTGFFAALAPIAGGGRSFRSRFRIAHVGDGGGSQPAERQHEGQRQESPHPMPAVLHQWFTSKFVRQGAKMVC